MATCNVSGTFTDPQGNAVVSATVRFNTQKAFLDGSGNLIMPKEITTTTASDGTWTLAITQGIAGNLTLDLNPTANSPVIKYSFSLIIPSASNSTFASCWVDSASFGGQTVTTSILFSQIAGQLGISQMPSLPQADIWVGNASSQATPVAMSGDISLLSTGAATVSTVGGSTAANIHAAEIAANAATSSASASVIASRDANANLSANNVILGILSVATSGGTTTLTAASPRRITFTGSSSQTLKLPAANTLSVNTQFDINNGATGTISVQNSTGSALFTIPAGGYSFTYCTDISTAAGVWDEHFSMPPNAAYGSSGMTVSGTLTVTGTVIGNVTGHASADLQTANNLNDLASRQTALNTLAGATTSGSYLRGNGTNILLDTMHASDLAVAVAPGTTGNVLTSDGAGNWTSATPGSTPVVSAIALINSFYSFS